MCVGLTVCDIAWAGSEFSLVDGLWVLTAMFLFYLLCCTDDNNHHLALVVILFVHGKTKKKQKMYTTWANCATICKWHVLTWFNVNTKIDITDRRHAHDYFTDSFHYRHFVNKINLQISKITIFKVLLIFRDVSVWMEYCGHNCSATSIVDFHSICPSIAVFEI